MFAINRNLWLKYIEQCAQHDSLFGITWSQLLAELSDMEGARRILTLNPAATPFHPAVIAAGRPLPSRSDICAVPSISDLQLSDSGQISQQLLSPRSRFSVYNSHPQPHINQV